MNQETIKATCACGAVASPRGMPGHLRSRAHAERMAALEASGDLPAAPTPGEQAIRGDDADEGEFFTPSDSGDDDIDIDSAEITNRKNPHGDLVIKRDIIEDDGDTITADRVIHDGSTQDERLVDAAEPFGENPSDVPDVIRGEGAETEVAGSYQASKTAENAGIRERHRQTRSLDQDERPNEYDVAVGDTTKVRDMVFDWAKDHRGFRHRFTYFYNRRNIILDFFDDKSAANQREAAEKARIVSQRNQQAAADDQIGYIPLVVGSPLRFSDLAKLERGEVLAGIVDTVAVGERIPAGRIVDMSAQSIGNTGTPEEERAV